MQHLGCMAQMSDLAKIGQVCAVFALCRILPFTSPRNCLRSRLSEAPLLGRSAIRPRRRVVRNMPGHNSFLRRERPRFLRMPDGPVPESARGEIGRTRKDPNSRDQRPGLTEPEGLTLHYLE